MSLVSLEIAKSPSSNAERHTYWRENKDGTRQALYMTTVAEGHSYILSSPDGSLERMLAEVAYTFETEIGHDTPGYDVLPTEKKKPKWRKK